MDKKLESGNVGAGTYSFVLYERPDGTRYIKYDIDGRKGEADNCQDLDEAVEHYLGENFFDDRYPEFSKWWQA